MWNMRSVARAGASAAIFCGLLVPALVPPAQAQTVATPPAPFATTGSVLSLGPGYAVVSGTVNSYGEAATYHFDYGTSTNYTLQTVAEPASFGFVDWRLTGLSPNTVYHYQLVATDLWGTSYGGDRTFTSGPGTSGGGTSGGTPPGASFTATSVVIHNKCGFVAVFNATGSSAPGGPITRYAWKFGDGSTLVTTSPVTAHSYHAGFYTVVLTVSDAAGWSATATRGVNGGSGSPYCA